MKGLGVSVAPWVNSGYGSQVGHAFPYMQSQGIEMLIYSYRGLIGRPVEWPPGSGMIVAPQGRNSQFGWEILPYWVNLHQPDFIFSLCNLFIFDSVKSLIAREGWPWYHWIPVDTSPLGAPDYNILNLTGIRPVAMSRFGQRMLAESGFDAPYIPHSIDCALFRPPSHQERLDSRAMMGFPEDAFIIGMNAANEASADRKGFYAQLCAFAAFRSRHPNALLYIHTVPYRHPVGLDLPSMINRLDIKDSVVFPDEQRYNAGAISYADLVREFYWTCDIGTHCSKAEGFGLPCIEFQACGVPVVATNCSTFPEIVARGEYGGYLVPGQPEWSTLDSSGWTTPIIDHVEQAYELYFMEHRSGEIAGRQIAARNHVTQYDHATVRTEFWDPFLSQLRSDHADRPETVSPPQAEPAPDTPA